MNNPVTMKDVAREAEVSRSVVSKVLTGSNCNIRVGVATAARVGQVADAMGYVANSAARAIRRGTFNTIGLLQGTVQPLSLLPPELLDSIQDAVAAKGKHLVLSKLPDEKLADEGFIPKILSESFADGLLVNYNAAIPPKMIALIKQHRIPSVWLNSKQSANCVYPDDHGGSYTATNHLIQLGHRRIMYINFAGEGHYSSFDREAGFRQAMQEAGYEPRSWLKEVFRRDSGEFVKDLLRRDDRPTAVVAYAQKETLAVLHAAWSLGLRIPEDLSFVTFRPTPVHVVSADPTCIVLPERAIGQAAVELLLQRIGDPSTQFEPIAVPGELYVGNTTSEAPAILR